MVFLKQYLYNALHIEVEFEAFLCVVLFFGQHFGFFPKCRFSWCWCGVRVYESERSDEKCVLR